MRRLAEGADPPGCHPGLRRDAGLPQPSGTGGWQAGVATGGRERGSERALPSGSEFQATGGTKLLAGNLGRAVVKVSAVAPEYRVIEAPAGSSSQHAVEAAYKAGVS